MSNHPIFYECVTSTTAYTDGPWEYTWGFMVNHDLDPLLIPCAHRVDRILSRPRICARTLEEHMLDDLGHTYVKDPAWSVESNATERAE